MSYVLFGVSGLGVLIGVFATAIAIAKPNHRIFAVIVAMLSFGSAAALVAAFVFIVSRM